MGAHTVVLDLLQIPYEKVSNNHNSQLNGSSYLMLVWNVFVTWFLDVMLSDFLSNHLYFYLFGSAFAQSDEKMNEIMTLAHTFLQNFCRGNPQNQVLLHKHLNLFLTPGVCWYDLALHVPCWHFLLLGMLYILVDHQQNSPSIKNTKSKTTADWQ